MKRIETIKFSFTRRGQKRAYYYAFLALRWLPLPVAEAEVMLATGQAVPHLATVEAIGSIQ